MKITAIKQQVKRADRYSIYVDEKYAFSFSESELLTLRLNIGQEFTQEELDGLKDKAVIDKSYDRSLNLIMRRPRSEWEIRDYLKRKEISAEVADEVISRLHGRSYLNDQDFARRWVESRRLLKSISKRRLILELRQKRVADDVIQQVLAEDETDEIVVVRELIERKRKQTKYQDDTKLMQFLSRQGFNYDTIKQALHPKD